MELGVEGVTISPGYSYERAPRQDVFLKRTGSKNLFRKLFELGKNKSWRFNQSSLYLDFLAGNQTYHCTPWVTLQETSLAGKNPAIYLLEKATQIVSNH